MRSKKWFGIVLCLLAVFIGILIAGTIILGVKALFGVGDEMEQRNWLLLVCIPIVIHSVLGGAIGALITWAIYRGPDLMEVARVSTWIYAILFIVLFAFAYSQTGWKMLHLEMLIQLVGIGIGLIGAAGYLQRRRGSREA